MNAAHNSLLHELPNNEAILLMYLANELPAQDREEVEHMLDRDDTPPAGTGEGTADVPGLSRGDAASRFDLAAGVGVRGGAGGRGGRPFAADRAGIGR